jgi:hypothetical protein
MNICHMESRGFTSCGMSRSFTYLGINLRVNYCIRYEQTDEPLKQRQQLRLGIRQLLVGCGASGTRFVDIHPELYPSTNQNECRSKAQNVEYWCCSYEERRRCQRWGERDRLREHIYMWLWKAFRHPRIPKCLTDGLRQATAPQRYS